MHVNALSVVVVVVVLFLTMDLLPSSQDACGDEAADTDSAVLALEGGAGIEISNQLPVPDSAVMTTPGT